MMRTCQRGVAAPRLLLALAVATLLCVSPASAGTGEVAAHAKVSALTAGLGVSASDRFGWSVASLGDFDGNGSTDLVVGAPFDDDAGTDTGAVYIVTLAADGSVTDVDKITEGAGGLSANLFDSDWFGWSVASLGDLDGDGTTDIAVGALQDDSSNNDAGAIYILFLNPNGTVKAEQRITGAQGGFGVFLEALAWFGCSIANLGDVDGDGVIDLGVGSFGDSENGVFRGAMYVLFLNSDGTVKAHQKINDSNGGLSADILDGDEFGWAAAGLGDLDGDGVEDMAVGAILDDSGNGDAGAVYVLFLNSDGTVKQHVKISSEAAGFETLLDQQDHFGRGVANIGDLNGDGVTDLAVGAVWDDDGAEKAGATYVLLMASDGTVIGEQKISATEGNFSATLQEGDTFGNSLAPLGDLNADGSLDIAVGADHDDDGSPDAGAVYLLFLDADAFSDIGNALAGTHGDPLLEGQGQFVLGQFVGVSLTNALESTLAWFVGSVAQLNVAFKGGVLVPDPTLGFAIALSTGPTGDSATLGGFWPSGVPSGVPVIFQCWIPDPGAIQGFAASNAVQGLTP
ncbi:MAG: hypothetical protein DRQ55_08790 [Planctomycetota bacterium]|nr:MAG: hypothetical protein DRQ55_08790 [Planctomycetota bacterium]